jgi:hypothetical protein
MAAAAEIIGDTAAHDLVHKNPLKIVGSLSNDITND